MEETTRAGLKMTAGNNFFTVAFQRLCFILDEAFLLHPHPQRDLRPLPRNNSRVLTFRAKRQLPPTPSHICNAHQRKCCWNRLPNNPPPLQAPHSHQFMHTSACKAGQSLSAARCTKGRCTSHLAQRHRRQKRRRSWCPSISMNSIQGCGTQKMLNICGKLNSHWTHGLAAHPSAWLFISQPIQLQSNEGGCSRRLLGKVGLLGVLALFSSLLFFFKYWKSVH